MRKLTLLSAFAAMLIGGQAVAQIDGSRVSPNDAYGPPVAVQLTQTQFGDNFSELDAAYAYNDGTNLYLILTGNVESNFNKLNIFIDSVPGGENTITPDVNNGGVNPANDGWANKYAGMTFDAGFNADFLLIARNGNCAADGFVLDFNSVGNDSVVMAANDLFGGNCEGQNGTLPNGIIVGFNNSNLGGVLGGTMAADQAAAMAVETGVEFAIPLAAIGAAPGDTILISAQVNGSNHDFLSNQFLGALQPAQVNLGGDGMGNFTGDLSQIDLTQFTGDQFFAVDGGADTDGDGVADTADNCREVANANQRDTDADGIGNLCDPDVAAPNDCIVNFLDLDVYKANFFQAGDLDTDNNGDGFTNFVDLGIVGSFFLEPPGPSANGCN